LGVCQVCGKPENHDSTEIEQSCGFHE
jgi:hypothetical protein